MPTFSNTPIPPTEPVTAKAASETVKAREDTGETASKAAFRVPPSDSVTVRHFREAPDATITKLNADLGLSLDAMRFARLKSFFTHSVRRDPTVGELRLLDALDRGHKEAPERLAVGELITESETLAATWADMMDRHGVLHGAGNAFRGATPVAAPPCSLTEALSLEGLYLYHTGLRLPPDDGRGSPDSRTVLLSRPEDEAVAAAEGYTPVARISFGKDTRSLWVRSRPSSEIPSLHPGDFLLYLPGLTFSQVQDLRSRLDALPIPSAVLAPVAASSLLLTALEICPSLDLYADRLTEPHTSLRGSRLPVELLCAPPTRKPDRVDHLLRVSLKQIKPVTELVRELGLSATVCGQARTGEQTVIRVRNPGGKEDIPVVRLPTEFLKATAAVYLRPFEVPRQTVNPPA
ncbi:MAG: hypothetical protein IJD38_07875, partial [Clostridia bacterium]|nr:hypothetical protein [Clostridia bacterium]